MVVLDGVAAGMSRTDFGRHAPPAQRRNQYDHIVAAGRAAANNDVLASSKSQRSDHPGRRNLVVGMTPQQPRPIGLRAFQRADHAVNILLIDRATAASSTAATAGCAAGHAAHGSCAAGPRRTAAPRRSACWPGSARLSADRPAGAAEEVRSGRAEPADQGAGLGGLLFGRGEQIAAQSATATFRDRGQPFHAGDRNLRVPNRMTRWVRWTCASSFRRAAAAADRAARRRGRRADALNSLSVSPRKIVARKGIDRLVIGGAGMVDGRTDAAPAGQLSTFRFTRRRNGRVHGRKSFPQRRRTLKPDEGLETRD